MPLNGLNVISLESRRARETETLIARQGGTPFLAPSLKERPIEEQEGIFLFLEALGEGAFDMVICMTGVGLALMRDAIAARMPIQALVEGLRRVTVVCRGPKPAVVLRQLEVPVHVAIPEPNTWREIADAVAARGERRIAVQEYGRANPELYAALRQLGAVVTPVTVYRWELPDDTGPLQEAVRRLAAGECDVILFTSATQLDHLLRVARELGQEPGLREALASRVAIASVGPVMSAALEAEGFRPDIVPAHPKLGPLVNAVAENAGAALARKRSR